MHLTPLSNGMGKIMETRGTPLSNVFFSLNPQIALNSATFEGKAAFSRLFHSGYTPLSILYKSQGVRGASTSKGKSPSGRKPGRPPRGPLCGQCAWYEPDVDPWGHSSWVVLGGGACRNKDVPTERRFPTYQPWKAFNGACFKAIEDLPTKTAAGPSSKECS